MQLSDPKEVLNLDGFLPSDGETGVEMRYGNRVLDLDIFYDSEFSKSGSAKRQLRFLEAKYFSKGPFPGPSLYRCPEDRKLALLNSLVAYSGSDILTMERQEFGKTDYKHYRLFLHSTGIAIHVVAESVEISSEVLIT